MKPKIIRTEEEYDSALARVETLMDLAPTVGSEEYDELELLGVLVERYEEDAFPMDSPDPVTAILFRMEQGGLSRADMTNYLGSPSKVSEVLSGKRPLSLTMIRKLVKGLGMSPEVLIQSEAARLPTEAKLQKV